MDYWFDGLLVRGASELKVCSIMLKWIGQSGLVKKMGVSHRMPVTVNSVVVTNPPPSNRSL